MTVGIRNHIGILVPTCVFFLLLTDVKHWKNEQNATTDWHSFRSTLNTWQTAAVYYFKFDIPLRWWIIAVFIQLSGRSYVYIGLELRILFDFVKIQIFIVHNIAINMYRKQTIELNEIMNISTWVRFLTNKIDI